jgi:hypothetical protein
MSIFNKKQRDPHHKTISLFTNLKTFFNMSKITPNKPVFKRNGIKNSHPYYISDSYKS